MLFPPAALLLDFGGVLVESPRHQRTLPRYLMSPERPAVVHGMPARYLVP